MYCIELYKENEYVGSIISMKSKRKRRFMTYENAEKFAKSLSKNLIPEAKLRVVQEKEENNGGK